MEKLKGSWALVTGASSGIGKEYADQLSQMGLNIIIVARREERLSELKKELTQKYNNEVEYFVADLTKSDACQKVFDFAIKDSRKIQMVINNAGAGSYGPFLDYTLDDHLKTIDLNIVSLTKLTYQFIAHMKEHGLPSFMTNIASIAAYLTVPQFGVYSGSKKYVRDLTETLAYEFKDTNIHLCCVCPGGTYTEFMDHAGQSLKKAAHAGMMSVEAVVSEGLDAMFKRKPSVITGIMNKLMCLVPRFLSSRFGLFINHHGYTMSVDYKKKEIEAPKSSSNEANL